MSAVNDLELELELGEDDLDMIRWIIIHEQAGGDPDEHESVPPKIREAAATVADVIAETGVSAWRYRHEGGLVTSDIGEVVNIRRLLTPDVCDAIERWRRHRAFHRGTASTDADNQET